VGVALVALERTIGDSSQFIIYTFDSPMQSIFRGGGKGSDEEHSTWIGGTIAEGARDSAVSPRACREAGGADTSSEPQLNFSLIIIIIKILLFFIINII